MRPARFAFLLACALLGGTSPGVASSRAAETERANVAERAEITFAGYNLKNYLAMDRRVDGESLEDAPKPDAEIEILIEMIHEIEPDILGVCEIGTESDLEDLASRLRAAGLDFPHREHTRAADPDRSLAILSRFPIVSTDHQTDLSYLIDKQKFSFSRGILDVTVKVNEDYRLRLLGLHLKSKRPVPEADQALMRRNEAHLLRLHIDDILEQDPEANLLVYGDFNDTRNETPIKAVQGRFGSEDYLRDIWLMDDREERWTYYWRTADQYSRFDFVFASRGLFPELNLEHCRIATHENWYTASDHRPLVITLVAQNRKIPGKR
ncbi:MAG: endonuclease/exonuclease/phosphatase family protein [Verrucomicrobiales bacterium]